MKKSLNILTLLTVLGLSSSSLFADVWVNGYTKSNGTYVEGHYRSDPDGIKSNNWSYKGNVNPHTGKIGSYDW